MQPLISSRAGPSDPPCAPKEERSSRRAEDVAPYLFIHVDPPATSRHPLPAPIPHLHQVDRDVPIAIFSVHDNATVPKAHSTQKKNP